MLKKLFSCLFVLCCFAPPALADFSLYAKDADSGDIYQLNFTVDGQGDAEFSSIGLVASNGGLIALSDSDALEFRHGKFHTIDHDTTNGSRLISMDKTGRQLFVGPWDDDFYYGYSLATDEDGVTWAVVSEDSTDNFPDCIVPIDLGDGTFDTLSKSCSRDEDLVDYLLGFDFDLFGDGTAYAISQSDSGNDQHFHTVDSLGSTYDWDDLRDITEKGHMAISNTTGHVIFVHGNPTKIYELTFDEDSATTNLLHTLTGGPLLSGLSNVSQLNLACDLDDDATLNSADDVGAMDDDYCEIEGTFTLDGWTVAEGGTAELVAGDSIILKPGTVINAGDVAAFKGTVDSDECPIVSPVCDFTI